jgi:hypothetical protein
VKITARYYQQFDADHARDVPAEAYGGWQSQEVEIDPQKTAVVSMHAWDCGTPEAYPGWWRCVEYIPRSHEICRTVYPPLLAAVRESELKLFHVVSDGDYYKDLPGYRHAVELAGGKDVHPEFIPGDPTLQALWTLKGENGFVGKHNKEDVDRGSAEIDFPEAARPQGDEGIARNADQLFALCKEAGVNHLVYIGFAINWCLLKSPGGMIDMSRRAFMCSTIPEAVTAVENKETAREELCKQIALWRVALAFGFVFDLDNFIAGLDSE